MRIKPEILANSKGIEVVESSAEQVTLRQRWFPFYRLPFFCAICGLFFFLIYFFWYPASWQDVLLIVPCIVFIIYVVAALCFNSTILTVTDSSLEWRYGPLPWLRGGMIDKKFIKAISFKGSGNHTATRHRTLSIHSVGVIGFENGQSCTIFHLMQSVWMAEMTARVIAGYLGDVTVEENY